MPPPMYSSRDICSFLGMPSQVQRPDVRAVIKLALASWAQALSRASHSIYAVRAEGVPALDHPVLLPAAIAHLAVQALAHVFHFPCLRTAACLGARPAWSQLGDLRLQSTACLGIE